nr:SURF1 family protein [Gemmatimonadaceae bacterium]
ALRGDTSELRYRRARITGIADYDQELILGNRSRSGAPGVNFLTPVRIPGSDTAVLVNRGWVYSPDAATPPDESWREQDTVSFEGYVDILAAGEAAPQNDRRPRLVPRATYASVAARLPYPVAGTYLVALLPEDSARTGIPARVALPEVTDEGPHLGYAFQWFIFATIAFVGAGIALRQGSPAGR